MLSATPQSARIQEVRQELSCKLLQRGTFITASLTVTWSDRYLNKKCIMEVQLQLRDLRLSFWSAATPQLAVTQKRGWVGAPTQELTLDGTLRLLSTHHKHFLSVYVLCTFPSHLHMSALISYSSCLVSAPPLCHTLSSHNPGKRTSRRGQSGAYNGKCLSTMWVTNGL